MLEKHYKNLALIVLGILVGLILCELTLRMFVSVRTIGPAFSVYDPTYGQKLKVKFSTQRITPEFSMRFTTNSLGFRGAEPNDFPYQPILFLGDSFTLGYGVNDGEEYPALIQEFLGKCFEEGEMPIVNAGIGKNGTGRWVKFLKKEGPRFDPSLIVFQMFINDFEDNLREGLFDIHPDGRLVELPVPSRGVVRDVQSLIEFIPGLPHSHLVGFARHAYWHFSHQPAELHSREASKFGGLPEDQLTFRLVEAVLILAEKNGWPVLGLLLDIDGERRNQLAQIFKKREASFLEIGGIEKRPDLYYPIDGHWTAAGHRYVASLVAEWLKRNEFVWKVTRSGQTNNPAKGKTLKECAD